MVSVTQWRNDSRKRIFYLWGAEWNLQVLLLNQNNSLFFTYLQHWRCWCKPKDAKMLKNLHISPFFCISEVTNIPMDDFSQLLRIRNNPRYQHRQCWSLAKKSRLVGGWAFSRWLLVWSVLQGGRTHRDSAIIFCGIKNRNIDISMFLFCENCKKCHFWQFTAPFGLQLRQMAF